MPVTDVSGVMTGRPCYEIAFDDGERIVCDSAHRWSVWDFTNPELPATKIVRTEEMLFRVRLGAKRFRYAIDCCEPIDMPEQDLILHPYVLGVWLGDGSSVMNHITVHEDDGEIAEHLRACGVDAEFRLPTWRKGKAANIVIDPTFRILADGGVSASSRFRSPFIARLRMLDVLGNKHVPIQYLRANREQRLELIRGLMDSDGSISPDGKRCEFSNTDPKLIDAFVELLRSLGYKPRVYWAPERRAVIGGGKPCLSLARWRASWTAYREEPMFKLSRKTARMRSIEKGRLWKSKRRRIIDIKPVASVPVRCISVNSPSHLYLCGKGWIPTHNTEAGNNWIGYVIHHAPGPMLAVQPTVELAKRFSRQRIEPLIAESPALRERVKPSRARDAGNTVLSKEFPGRAADHHRRQQRGRPALDAGALPVSGRGRCLPAVRRRGGRSGRARRSANAHLLVAERRFSWPRRRRSTGSRASSGNTRPRISAATSCRARTAGTCSGSSSSGCAGTRGSLRPHIMNAIACDGRIEEHHKTAMLQAGEWRATAEGADPGTIGFHLSALYSPVGWFSWADIARMWEAAQSTDEAKRSFKNGVLGLTWVETGEAPDWQRLYERREAWQIGTVPRGGLFLTAGADVQKDRIEVDVWAWGRGLESWLVDHIVIDGGPEKSGSWKLSNDC